MMVDSVTVLLGVPGSGRTTIIDTIFDPARGWQRSFAVAPIRHHFARHMIRAQFQYRLVNTDDTAGAGEHRLVHEMRHSIGPSNWVVWGDRVLTDKFFEEVLDHDMRLIVVFLDTPPLLAAARHRRRWDAEPDAEHTTKVLNLAGRWAAFHIDGKQMPGAVSDAFAEILSVQSKLAEEAR